MKRLRTIFLASAIVFCQIAYAGMDMGAVKQVNLGAKFDKVWFNGGGGSETRPYVGLELSAEKLKVAILDTLSLPSDALSDRIDSFINSEDERAQSFFYRNVEDEEWAKPEAVLLKGGTIVVILPAENSYNDTYEVGVSLKPFQGAVKAENQPDFLTHNSSLKMINRGSITAYSNLARQSTTLITAEKDGMGEFVKNGDDFAYNSGEGARVNLKVSYEGIANPVQSLLNRKGHGYHKIVVSGTLTELPLDSQSNIKLEWKGVTDLYNVLNGLGTVALGIETSQNMRQTAIYYEPGLRFNDRRITEDTFISENDVLSNLFYELSVQLGGIFNRSLDDVPDPDRFQSLYARPKFTIGFADLGNRLWKNSQLAISGRVIYYYVSKELGATGEFEGFAPVYEVTFGYGPRTQRFVLTIKGGTNPINDFIKLKPTYNLGVESRF